jgi:hypothetical protein
MTRRYRAYDVHHATTGPEAPTPRDAAIAHLYRLYRDRLDVAPDVLEVVECGHTPSVNITHVDTAPLLDTVRRIRWWDCEEAFVERLIAETPAEAVTDYLEERYLDGDEAPPAEVRVTGLVPMRTVLRHDWDVLEPIYERLEDEYGWEGREPAKPGPEVVDAAKRLVDLILAGFVPGVGEGVVTWWEPTTGYEWGDETEK